MNYSDLTIDQLSTMTLEELAALELENTAVSIYPVTASVVSAAAEATADAELISITFIDSWS